MYENVFPRLATLAVLPCVNLVPPGRLRDRNRVGLPTPDLRNRVQAEKRLAVVRCPTFPHEFSKKCNFISQCIRELTKIWNSNS